MKSLVKAKWEKVPHAARVSVAYTVCSIVQRCISLLTLPIFTRLLTTKQYGQATIYSSWMSLLMLFITLYLPYESFSAAMVKYEDRRDEYISSAEGICLMLAGVFLVIYLPFSGLWNRLFQLPTFIMVLMVFDIVAASALAFWTGKKRFEFRYKEVIAVTIAIAVVTPVLQILIALNVSEKGYGIIAGGSITSIIIGGTLLVILVLRGKRIYNREFWKYALGFNIPLLFYYLSQIIFNTSDRIMISHMVGTDKAAIYGLAYMIGFMLNFVLISINNSYVPWFFNKIKEGKQKENIRVANMIAILLAILLLGVVWFAPEIIRVIGGKKYREAVWIVPPVAMSVLLLFYSQLSINVLLFYEKKRTMVQSSIGAAIVNIVLNFYLIPVFGYYAAGYTTFFSYIAFAVLNYMGARMVEEERGIRENSFDIKSLGLIFVLFSLLVFVGTILYRVLVARAVITAVVLVTVLLFRKRVRSMFGT